MSGIIEIWRREAGTNLPTRFTIGAPPMLPNGTPANDSPIVSSIVFRESGAFAGLRMDGPVFCISFEGTFVQRFIPAREIIESAYETKKADVTKTPALEA